LGTLWPLFVEVMTGKDISVGAPYFNLVFLPIIMPAIFVSGVIININWKRNTVENLLKKLNKAIIIFVFLVGVILFLLEGPIIFFIGIILSIWLLISIINDFYEKIRTKKSISDIKLSKAFSIPISTYGMYLAHFGLAVFILGVAISDSKKLYYEGVMKEKEIVKVEKFKIQLKEIVEKKEKNWISRTGNFSVEGFKKNISMFAERRLYLDTGMPSTEAAIYRNFFSHLYIVMGQEQPLNSGKRIVRIYFNPFIILIWSGAFLMAFGGLISICDKKRNR
jgi:cytochrome c-type biogenesis protein CcmF